MSYVVASFIGVALAGVWLWAVLRWAASPSLPPTCSSSWLRSGLALLPGAGWVLGILFPALLPVRPTEADAWPDAVLAVTGSGAVRVVTGVTRTMLTS